MRFLYSRRVLDHEAQVEFNRGVMGQPFERGDRAKNVAFALETAGFGELEEPSRFADDHVFRVHDADFVHFIKDAHSRWRAAGRDGDASPMCWRTPEMRPGPPQDIDAQLGYYAFDVMTPITAGTWSAARGSVDAALTGAAHLASGAGSSAFALCRPPGHHAGRGYYGGYCFLNSAAVSAQYLRDQGMARIAIFDPDYHHGNGTQDIFYSRNDVLYVSLHADPATDFPFYTGFADETGAEGGDGFNLNIPLPRGTGWQEWSDAFGQAEKRILAFSPDALIVSLGVDTLSGDPLAKFAFQSDDFFRLGHALARIPCPTLFVFEGGYAVDEIGESVVRCLQGFLERHRL